MKSKASPFPPKTDFYSKSGAGLLAEHINSYWMTRGYHGIVAQRFKLPGQEVYGVRSNMVAGIPPRRRPR